MDIIYYQGIPNVINVKKNKKNSTSGKMRKMQAKITRYKFIHKFDKTLD